MINLRNDYCTIAHKNILKKLMELESNKDTFDGYGLDVISDRVKSLIIDKVGNKKSSVHFLVGGTSANKLLISHVLLPYESVIAVDSAHICVHETGAIENNGHKINVVANACGKICVDDIKRVVEEHKDEHMVKPKLVCISNSTEYGTTYTKKELIDIYNTCKELGLYLYVDGARIANAIASESNDITLKDYGKYTDAFYIGGTKIGAMIGEALVINNPELNKNFRYTMKQNGGMLAKSFIIAAQFEALFEDDLMFELARKENELADRLRNGLLRCGVEIYNNNGTNQIFALFDSNVVSEIKKEIICEQFGNIGDKVCLRFVTHYDLNNKDIDAAIKVIKNTIKKG